MNQLITFPLVILKRVSLTTAPKPLPTRTFQAPEQASKIEKIVSFS